MRFTRALVIVIVSSSLFLAGGCSKLRFVYDHVDWFLMKKTNEYLDLNDSQEEEFEKDLAAFLAWHRRNMVPRYAAFLRGNAEAIKKDEYPREYFDSQAELGEKLLRDTIRPILPDLAAVMAKMNEEQIGHLEETLKDANEKMQEKVGDKPDNRVDSMIDSIETMFDRWFTELNRDQVKMVKNYLRENLGNPDAWWKERLRRQKVLYSLLRGDGSDETRKVREFLMTIALEPEAIGSKEYKKQYRHFREKMNDLTYRILSSLTPQQKRRMSSRLSFYASEFEAISGVGAIKAAN